MQAFNDATTRELPNYTPITDLPEANNYKQQNNG
jgi:hypothetical protein